MSLQSDIVTALAAIAAGRVYPQAAPEDASLPFVVYRQLGADPVMTLNGYAGITRFTYLFECWAGTYAESMTLASSVQSAIEAAAALKPQSREQGDPDDFEPLVDEYMLPVLYSFWHV